MFPFFYLHLCPVIPYAAIGGFSKNDVRLFFASAEFVQEVDLLTGEIISLSVGTYNNDPVGIEALKRDIQKLNGDFSISGNS